MPIETVGELRELLSKLPDDAEILPDWHDGPPGDTDPAVVLHDFGTATSVDGKDYLSVKVNIKYLNDDDWDDLDDEDTELDDDDDQEDDWEEDDDDDDLDDDDDDDWDDDDDLDDTELEDGECPKRIAYS